MELTLLVDPLSIVMALIVSGVGALIVLYSIGYMHGADEERRYFAYMSIFLFAMLLLVLAANYVILLAGWGLVGLASYLLIGFEHERPAAVAAAKKAFIMNAVGDATMALAIVLLIWKTGTVDFLESFEALGGLSETVIVLVALGLLGGAVAKSAQIPLHTWLPDAMEGPTPVSALIHAATMVTAGVYLLVRLHPIYEDAASVQDLAAGLGAITLLAAGLIALVQTDIKRVIAYSTMSQIGYMFLGAGIAAYDDAVFHLMTHAFFKALLFLGAGVLIHALVGQQDMRQMGGLRQLMPRTYLAMLVGALALAAIPPFGGFFSKDAILASALARGDWWGTTLFVVGIVGAFLTGLYAFRMIFMAFGGEQSPYVREHFHAGTRGGAAVDDVRRRRARRARDDRRLDRDRRPLAPVLDLPRPGRLRRRPRAPRPRRAVGGAGLVHLAHLGRGRGRRHLARVAPVGRRAAGRSRTRPRSSGRSSTSSTSTRRTTSSSTGRPRRSGACGTAGSRGRSSAAR